MKIKGTDITITKTQESNLRKLIDHVLNLPDDYKRFNMKSFTGCGISFFEMTKESVSECGTSGCFLGHGFAAGVIPNYNKTEGWGEYAKDCFGIDRGLVWRWLFSVWWQSITKDAALRAQYLLDCGLPEDFSGNNIDTEKFTKMVNSKYDVVWVGG